MREIKFRSFDLISGKFLPVWWNSTLTKGGVLTQENGIKLMQYTGLKDKNGKEIYEGDIVTRMTWVDDYTYRIHPNKYTVDWCDDGAKFEMYSPDEMWGECEDGTKIKTSCEIEVFAEFGTEEDSIEVIGNIYQNPELIK